MPRFLPRRCREGAALWRVLQLNDSYDLDTYLDMSQVRESSRRLWGPLPQIPLLWPCFCGATISLPLRSN